MTVLKCNHGGICDVKNNVSIILKKETDLAPPVIVLKCNLCNEYITHDAAEIYNQLVYRTVANGLIGWADVDVMEGGMYNDKIIEYDLTVIDSIYRFKEKVIYSKVKIINGMVEYVDPDLLIGLTVKQAKRKLLRSK